MSTGKNTPFKKTSKVGRSAKIHEVDGVGKTLAEWCEEKKLNFYTVRARMANGMSIIEALETPVVLRAEKNRVYLLDTGTPGYRGMTPTRYTYRAMIERCRPDQAPDSTTTSPDYHRSHLLILDAMAKAMSGEGMQVGEQAKNWLNEDEYLTRRRIHSDANYAMKKAGF